MFILRGLVHTARTFLHPPLDFVPALFAGLHLLFGLTFMLRRDLFAFTNNYAVMQAWFPEWVWGVLSLFIGLAIASTPHGPSLVLRAGMFGSTLFLASIAYALAVGPVGWGPYTTMVAYLACGSGRCYAQLGRKGRRG